MPLTLPEPTALPQSMPRLVAWLGYGGLVPFVALALLGWLAPTTFGLWKAALLGYGAVILSFVGALHWGFAMASPGLSLAQRNACYAWSVVPALLAWPALLAPPVLATLLLVAGFAAHYRQDQRLARWTVQPPWYLPLRLRLTATACLCLVAGALAAHWPGAAA